MKPFDNLTTYQVVATRSLHSFLRRLNVIGLVKSTTDRFGMSEFGKPIRYSLRFVEYDPSMKGKLTEEERIVYMLVDACIQQTE